MSADRSRRRRSGFTFIETLAVIVFIAALASLMTPVLASAKKGAYRTVCMVNLRQIGTATSLYLGDNEDRYPAVVNEFTKVSRAVALGRPRELDPTDLATPVPVMIPYLKSTEVFECPKDAGRKFPRFSGLPTLHAKNGGTSYLIAELFEGQSPSGWKDPTKEIWACDGGLDWHWPVPPSETSVFHRVNALAYDFHVQVVTGESITPTWMQ